MQGCVGATRWGRGATPEAEVRYRRAEAPVDFLAMSWFRKRLNFAAEGDSQGWEAVSALE